MDNAPADGPADRQVLDPHNLRGLAHPLRVRLLAMLRRDGPSTATRLAERAGQSSGATSYHLRQLAAYGFVVEDEGTGSGRERWWKATSRRFELPGATARRSEEAEGFLRAVAADHFQRVDAFLGELPALPDDWDEGWALNDAALRLTPAEARRLLADLGAVIARYRRDPPEPGAQPPAGAEHVTLQVQLLPQVADDAADPVPDPDPAPGPAPADPDPDPDPDAGARG